MPHLNGIGLENFRVFKDKQWFDFAPITILTGTNSSGKSTVINALRLLKSNYRNIGNPRKGNRQNEIKSLELDKLLTRNFDAEDILRRYGNVKQFVNNESNKNEFGFVFKCESIEVQDDLEINLTIECEDNRLKNGVLKKISVIAGSTSKEIFLIERKLELDTILHCTKIDFVYFYKAFKTWIDYFTSIEEVKCKIHNYNTDNSESLKNEIDRDIVLHNKTFSDEQKVSIKENIYFLDPNLSWMETHPLIDKDIFTGVRKLNSPSVIKDFKQGKIYDFSILEKISAETYVEFLSLIKSYYGEISETTYQKITKDILETLSSIEWRYKGFLPHDDMQGVDNYLYFDKSEKQTKNFGMSLNYFVNNLIHTHGVLIDNASDINTSADVKKIILRVKKELKHENKFIKEIFESLISFFAPPYFITNKQERDSFKVVRMEHTNVEKVFYNDFIFSVLSQIKKPFEYLERIEFVEASRMNIQRNFQLSENNKFSGQIKGLLKQSEKKYKDYLFFINKWLKHFDIAEKMEIISDGDADNFKIYLFNKNKKVPLADYGYGVSQILPIIISLIPDPNKEAYEWDSLNEPEYFPKLIVLEEPENSLHPALQSKLADMFAEAVKKFNIQLIVETHSEYLIRKLQYLTAKKEISPDDTQIYYFYNPDKIPEGEPQVKKINIEQDGSLNDNFGEGFFDEANSIKIELLTLQKSQTN